jgi:hemolysin activation/secretion protein
MQTHNPKKLLVFIVNFFVVNILLSLSISAFAATPIPDSGQINRENKNQPVFSDLEKNIPEPVRTEPAKKEIKEISSSEKENVKSVLISIKSIHISGNTVFSTAELLPLISYLINKESSFDEINLAADKITAFYQSQGYLVSKAYLPEQEIKDGVVEIKIVEGILGEKYIKNNSTVILDTVNNYLKKIKIGQVLDAKPIDSATYLLNELPGIATAKASLQAGKNPGEVDLMIEINPSKKYNGSVTLDNYGSRFTGYNRLDTSLSIDSPLNRGDFFKIRAITTDGNMNFNQLSYDFPFDHIGNGFRLGFSYNDTKYQLGNELSDLLAKGSTSASGLYASYPLYRSQKANLSSTLTYEKKLFDDYAESTGISSSKTIESTTLDLSGNYQDSFGGGAYNSFGATLSTGNLTLDPFSSYVDYYTTKSEGNFSKINYNFNRTQKFNDTNTISIGLSGQESSKNLNSSEQFTLGGPNGVRAYPQGEATGDTGGLASIEWHHHIFKKSSLNIFYDTGYIKRNRFQYNAEENYRTISGAGIGLDYGFHGVQTKTYLAWTTDGGKTFSDPYQAQYNSIVWFQASKQF